MAQDTRSTIGLDVGDSDSHYCELDQGSGEILRRGTFRTNRVALRRALGGSAHPACARRVVLEVGTHSPWMSRELTALGSEVLVANARELRFIFGSRNKTDRVDAEKLARVGRMDPKLLHPIQHRSEEDQLQIMVLRARDGLVAARSRLVGMARGLTKSYGLRIPKCSTPAFPHRVRREELPPVLAEVLDPVLESIESLSERIKTYDKRVEKTCERERYRATAVLQQVDGVGALTSLALVLILQDPARFARSRDVGAYLGLTPARNQSGQQDPDLGITKEGDPFARRLLVQSANYILGPFAKDSDLRRFGQRLMANGLKKRKAVIAVARKLAVLLHRLWRGGEVYEPLRNATPTQPQ